MTTHNLTQREIAALKEFSGKRDGWICLWKPKSMSRLAEIGLTKRVTRWIVDGDPAYIITPAGRAALKQIEEAE